LFWGDEALEAAQKLYPRRAGQALDPAR